jgi:hypothetical protein
MMTGERQPFACLLSHIDCRCLAAGSGNALLWDRQGLYRYYRRFGHRPHGNLDLRMLPPLFLYFTTILVLVSFLMLSGTEPHPPPLILLFITSNTSPHALSSGIEKLRNLSRAAAFELDGRLNRDLVELDKSIKCECPKLITLHIGRYA